MVYKIVIFNIPPNIPPNVFACHKVYATNKEALAEARASDLAPQATIAVNGKSRFAATVIGKYYLVKK
jgi:hypothetical protein